MLWLFVAEVTVIKGSTSGAAARLAGKSFVLNIGTEKLIFSIFEKLNDGRDIEFLDFCVLWEYNSVR